VTDRPVLAGALGARDRLLGDPGAPFRAVAVHGSVLPLRVRLGLESQAWLVLLALSSQVLGWLLISVSLPRLPALLTSILLMLQPVSTVFLAALLLSEAPSAVQLLGVAVVIAGVAVATLRLRAPAPV
jgi:drug/metabolite transporter (DMT)-like permease